MTQVWFAKYCEEAYAIFDAKDSYKARMIRRPVITRFLAGL